MYKDPGARVALSYGFKRSPKWPAARRAYLRRQPSCAACPVQYKGLKAWFIRLFTHTVVHHIVPFHICRALDRPDLELDTRNFLTLCGEHHFVLGHFRNFGEFNLYVKACVIRLWGKSPSEVLSNSEYQRFSKDAYKSFSLWTGEEMAAFRMKLDEKFPPK